MNKITFLGTGTSQGIPLIGCQCFVCCSTDKRDKRLRSSVHIEHEGVHFIIDTGPDFRYQMLRANILDIDAILFTHSHKDHIAGLDDVRAYNYILKKDMDIYAEAHTMRNIKREFEYAFSEIRYPGVPNINDTTISTVPFYVKGIEVIPIRGMHFKLPVLGFRIGDITYLTDMNKIDDTEIEKAKGSKIVVIDALRHEEHISHFTVSEAIEVAKKIGAERTYFTHMSHQIGLHEVENSKLPQGMEYAYDELVVETR